MESNSTASSLPDFLSELPYLEMGGGFLIGLGVGYFLKKSFKIALFAVGIIVALLFGLEQLHVVHIDANHLEETVEQGAGWFKEAAFYLKERLAGFGVAGSGSAVAGFLVGLKMG